MSEVFTSTDSLTARKDELIGHLIEGDKYLTDERKEAISRDIAHIAFELSMRAGDD